MRVIGGSARGRRLKAPRGLRTRPMADKIREALFSMLDSLGIRPQRVLDLYAGSGAIGIENALARCALGRLRGPERGGLRGDPRQSDCDWLR
jgi:16S rRNA (guanine966-N2)-methyltransferase